VLVATIALALAIVRPEPRPAAPLDAAASATGSGRRLVVIDSSWSMLAATGRGTRWDRAVATARTLIASAAGEEVALATTADGLVEGPTADVSLVEAALDHLSPAGGESAAWPRVAGAGTVHFITDGTVARPLDPGVVIHSVFEAAANVAITAFDARPDWSGELAGHAYLEIANYAGAPQAVHLVITRGATPVLDRSIDMAAGEAVRQILPLDRGGDPRLRAHIEAPSDALAIDDDAGAWVTLAQPLAVAIVSDQPAPFGALLSRDPDVRATLIAPAAYRPGNEDVVIFDRWLPADPPTIPAFVVAPPASAWLGAAGAEETQPRWETAGTHPIARGVDPLTMLIGKARATGRTDLVPIVESARGTPLFYVAESPALRLVVATFDMSPPGVSSAPGFPVVVGNVLDWLARPESGRQARPGPATFDAGVTRLVDPDGQPLAVTRVGDEALATLRAPGFYTVERGAARSVLAVNVGDPEISDVQRTNLAESARARSTNVGLRGRPWWLYCVAIAFVLLAGEWWTWQRRIMV
jgi:hypothetical protein